MNFDDIFTQVFHSTTDKNPMNDMKLGKLNLPRFIKNTAEKLAEINEAGADGTKAKKLVRKMRETQIENMEKLKEPSVHMQKFAQAIKKLNVL